MEKLAENDEEILYINKNNPFGIEKIKELSNKLKNNLELVEEAFPENQTNTVNEKKEENDNEEVQRMIKFYKTQNSKDSMDFKEDMCEFIFISPEIDNEQENNSPTKKIELLGESNMRKSYGIGSSSPLKKSSETVPMYLPKEFLVSENPFNNKARTNSNSLGHSHSKSVSQSPTKTYFSASKEKLKFFEEDHVEKDSMSISDSESEEENWSPPKKDAKEETKNEEEIDSSESEENEELMIKYKVPFTYSKLKCQEIWALVKSFNGVPAKDEARCDNSYKSGGQIRPDPETVKNIRSLGKEIIKEIGRKIISGSFNLTTISFPIKCMIPKSALETIFQGS